MSLTARIPAPFLALILAWPAFASSAAGEAAGAARPSAAPAPHAAWTLIREAPVAQGTQVVAFQEDHLALAAGCTPPMARTVDGGSHWAPLFFREVCHQGLEVLPELTVTTGGSSFAGEVDRCADCWERWEGPGATFGGPPPRHARHLSFVDARRGALATDEELNLTRDGGRTLRWIPLPEGASAVAAVSLAEEGEREILRLLDQDGRLWRSDDRGGSWRASPSPLPGGVVQPARGPGAALRFSGPEGVLAAAIRGVAGPSGRVYRTRDAGETWAEEALAPPFGTAVVTLSYDAGILSALDVGRGVVGVYRRSGGAVAPPGETPAPAPAAAPAPATTPPGAWRLARQVAVQPGATVASFSGDRDGFVAGCTVLLFRSTDGGASWSPRIVRHLCRYGLELLPGLLVNTGNLGYAVTGEVSLSTDGGASWRAGAPFGGAVPHHARQLSFLDARRGAIATDQTLGLTTDGARTWRTVPLPAAARRIAAISLAEEGSGLVLRLLDQAGLLWRSDDEGRSWASAPSPLPGGVREPSRGPTAALRFTGATGVLAATLDEEEGLSGHVYRTRDAGRTWSEEPLAVPFRGAALTLSADGRTLTALEEWGTTARVYHPAE